MGSLREAHQKRAFLCQKQECEGRASSRPREDLGWGVRPGCDARPEDGRQDGNEDKSQRSEDEEADRGGVACDGRVGAGLP